VRLDSEQFEPRAGLFKDVIDEITWTFTDRRGWIAQVVLNLVIGLPVVIWLQWSDRLSDHVQVAGLATSIGSWVLASTLNTDQLGYDADRAAASLEVGDRASRILFLKNVAIALILAPIIFGISIVLRLVIHNAHDSIGLALVRDVGSITIWLGFGSLLSVLLPFRPIGWRQRLADRSSWPRFALCVTVPYLVLYGLARFWHLPEVAIANALFHSPHHHEWGYSLILMGWGLATWGVGLLLAELYADREAKRIVRHLRHQR
jgi:hypothetical protein